MSYSPRDVVARVNILGRWGRAVLGASGSRRLGAPSVASQFRLDLAGWWRYRPNLVLLVIGCASAFAGLRATSGPSFLVSALGGPWVTTSPAGLIESGGWPWLFIMAAFAVASGGTLKSGGLGWSRLELCRTGRRSRWVVGKLLAGAVTSFAYLGALVVAVALRYRLSGSREVFMGHQDVWEWIALTLTLLGIAWSKLVLELTPRAARFGAVIVLVALAAAAFGGVIAPVIPFAQAIVGLHGQPGTLSVALGIEYGMSWAALCACLSLYLGATRSSW